MREREPSQSVSVAYKQALSNGSSSCAIVRGSHADYRAHSRVRAESGDTAAQSVVCNRSLEDNSTLLKIHSEFVFQSIGRVFRALCCVDHKRNVCHGITSDDRVATSERGRALGRARQQVHRVMHWVFGCELERLSFHYLSFSPPLCLISLQSQLSKSPESLILCIISSRPVGGRERSFTARSSYPPLWP